MGQEIGRKSKVYSGREISFKEEFDRAILLSIGEHL